MKGKKRKANVQYVQLCEIQSINYVFIWVVKLASKQSTVMFVFFLEKKKKRRHLEAGRGKNVDSKKNQKDMPLLNKIT